MKKSRRMEAFNQLLKEAKSKDFDTSEFALLQIALVLEQSNLVDHKNTPDIYADNLSRELLNLQLNADDQENVVGEIARLIAANSKNRPTLYWALGKAKPEIALPALLGLLKAQGKNLNEETAYQAAISLHALTKGDLSAEVQAKIALNDPTDLLEKWADANDDRLADLADDILDNLDS